MTVKCWTLEIFTKEGGGECNDTNTSARLERYAHPPPYQKPFFLWFNEIIIWDYSFYPYMAITKHTHI